MISVKDQIKSIIDNDLADTIGILELNYELFNKLKIELGSHPKVTVLIFGNYVIFQAAPGRLDSYRIEEE